jgi:microcystin-dependent protein
MQFRDLFNLTLGRLWLPLRSTPATPGELVQDGRVLRYRTVETTPVNLRVLTDDLLGQPSGVCPLGADGKVPANFLPGSSPSGAFVGQIADYFGDPRTIPTGYLLCDGGEYLRTLFPSLFAIIGTRAGRPSSDLLFKVPDLTGRTTYGAAGGPGADAGGIHKLNIISGGAGYTDGSYATTLVGGAFSVAAAVDVLVVAGIVVRARITAPGTYTSLGLPDNTGESNCAVKIPSGPLGAGIGLRYEVFAVANTNRQVAAIVVTNHGAGYVTAPDVAINGPSLVGATGRAVLEGGQVREIVLTNSGYGDPTGATVTLTGGGFSTAATAAVKVLSPRVAVGDALGEDVHAITIPELAAHTHTYLQGGGVGSPNSDDEFEATLQPTGSTGGDQPHETRAPGFGVLKLIRAV